MSLCRYLGGPVGLLPPLGSVRDWNVENNTYSKFVLTNMSHY
jgi:hypothetical protein